MSYSGRSRYSISPPPKRYRSMSRSRSRSYDSSDAENPGNNLYVTGLSTRVTKRDLEKHFSSEGKVEDVHLVVDPRTRESRGFGFVTMSTLKEADRCIKYLDGSALEGRVITVEKSRRKRGRTPTPGRYLGLRASSVRCRSSSYSRSRSPRYLSESDGSSTLSRSPYYSRRHRRSYTPYRQRIYSPYDRLRRSYSPYESHGRSYSRSRSRSYSRSPSRTRGRDRSYSPYYYRGYSPEDRYYRRREDRHYRRGRGRYRSISPRESTRNRRRCRRSYSRSVSVSSKGYSRSMSPRDYRRSYYPSVSPSPRSYEIRTTSPAKSLKRSASRGSHGDKKRSPSYGSRSSRSHSRSPSVSSSSGSRSRSVSSMVSP